MAVASADATRGGRSAARLLGTVAPDCRPTSTAADRFPASGRRRRTSGGAPNPPSQAEGGSGTRTRRPGSDPVSANGLMLAATVGRTAREDDVCHAAMWARSALLDHGDGRALGRTLGLAGRRPPPDHQLLLSATRSDDVFVGSEPVIAESGKFKGTVIMHGSRTTAWRIRATDAARRRSSRPPRTATTTSARRSTTTSPRLPGRPPSSQPKSGRNCST